MKTQQEILSQFQEAHGDLYDYSLVDFKNVDTKVKIICKTHGIFEQVPVSHRKGIGCKKCSKTKPKLKTEQVIKQFQEAHGDLYDYSLVEYNGAQQKILIKCLHHGEFTQTPTNHKNGSGCPTCAGNMKMTESDIIKKFIKAHGYQYIYNNINIKTQKVQVYCMKHGLFIQDIGNHISGHGCKRCNSRRISDEELINQFKLTHGDKYDYSLVNTYDDKVNIICPIHGLFTQGKYSHKSGSNCPSCAKTGFDGKKPAVLYYISIDNGRAYKIGITNRTTTKRLYLDRDHIKIIREWYFEDGFEALAHESKIIDDFRYAKWTGEKLMKNGNTEVFDRDILMLDNEELNDN